MSVNSVTQKAVFKKKITVPTIIAKKNTKIPITMLTAYDYSMAVVMDRAGVDMILVGDSLGMVVLGYESTLPVTMDDMLHHAKAVARGAKNPLLVGDMPFMSYQASIEQAVLNAGRFLAEGGMDAIKLEGGKERADTVRAIVSAGIPVVGHIGLTPQSVQVLGGYKTQGKTAAAAKKLIDDALALQEAGCFAIVMESMPTQLARLISEKLTIPTIGIGAGSACDGQVLVINDVLGLFDRFLPKFVKQYANFFESAVNAVEQYIDDVQTRAFPAEEHETVMAADEWEKLIQEL